MSDPKLISAMAQIKAIVDAHDIAAMIVLHNAPGEFEVLTALEPSYSKISGLPPAIRIRTQLADYGGDKAAQLRDMAATANMVSGMGEMLATNGMWMLELAEVLDKKFGAEHTGFKKTDGTKQ